MPCKIRKTFFSFMMFSLFLSAGTLAAQEKLTKKALVAKANALFEGGRAREALDLIDEYPEFSDETEILYVKSAAYVELRDFKNADAAFQKQFDAFTKDAAESRAAAEKILKENAPTKETQALALLMYSTSLMSYGTADLVNSLRAEAFEKAGIADGGRRPGNLSGFEKLRRDYEETALKAGELCLQTNQLKDALYNFNKAIELNPENASAYAGRARIYRRMKKIKLAASDEAKAKRLAQRK